MHLNSHHNTYFMFSRESVDKNFMQLYAIVYFSLIFIVTILTSSDYGGIKMKIQNIFLTTQKMGKQNINNVLIPIFSNRNSNFYYSLLIERVSMYDWQFNLVWNKLQWYINIMHLSYMANTLSTIKLTSKEDKTKHSLFQLTLNKIMQHPSAWDFEFIFSSITFILFLR